MVRSIADPDWTKFVPEHLGKIPITGNPRIDAMNQKFVGHHYWRVSKSHQMACPECQRGKGCAKYKQLSQKAVRGDFAGINFRWAAPRNVNLSDADLHGAVLENIDLGGSKVIRANAQGIKLKGSYIHWGDWSYCNLSNSDCQATSWWGTSLKGADLRNCDFSHASFWNCDMSEAKIDGAQWSKIRAYGDSIKDFFKRQEIKFNER